MASTYCHNIGGAGPGNTADQRGTVRRDLLSKMSGHPLPDPGAAATDPRRRPHHQHLLVDDAGAQYQLHRLFDEQEALVAVHADPGEGIGPRRITVQFGRARLCRDPCGRRHAQRSRDVKAIKEMTLFERIGQPRISRYGPCAGGARGPLVTGQKYRGQRRLRMM